MTAMLARPASLHHPRQLGDTVELVDTWGNRATVTFAMWLKAYSDPEVGGGWRIVEPTRPVIRRIR